MKGAIPYLSFCQIMLLNFFSLVSIYLLYNLLIKSSLTKNAVLVALYIVGSFISAGLFYLLIDFSLLGVMLIIVYVGAVVVLFVFVSMILPLRLSLLTPSKLLIAISYFVWFLVLTSLISTSFNLSDNLDFFSYRLDILQMFGLLLYTQKSWYFLIAAVLLTIAMIGAILLTQNTLARNEGKEIINLQLNKNYTSDLLLYI